MFQLIMRVMMTEDDDCDVKYSYFEGLFVGDDRTVTRKAILRKIIDSIMFP